MKKGYFWVVDECNRKKQYECPNKCEIGDIVTITDYGQTYSTYTKAFIYFNMIGKCVKSCGNELDYYYNPVTEKEAINTNWVIVGIGMHPRLDDILYCLKSPYNDYLLIGCEGVEVKKLKNKCNMGFVNNSDIIHVIPI